VVYSYLTCPICNEKFKQEKPFKNHLLVKHHIENDLSLYLEIFHNSTHPTCSCSHSCDKKLKWSGWKKGFLSKFFRGHNAKKDSTFLDKDKQQIFAKKRKEGFVSGKYKVWNAGLSKETNNKILESSKKISETLSKKYTSGEIKDWRLRDTKKAKSVALKISETKRKKYDSGETQSWNSGLTKNTSSSVLSTSQKIKGLHKTNPEICTKRLAQEEFINRINNAESTLVLATDCAYKNKYQKFDFRCTKCNAIQTKNLMMFEYAPICFSCYPKESKAQLEIYEFVKQIYPDAILSDNMKIKPKELDVYVPSKNVAIEYNGLYWHSVANSHDVMSHQTKHVLCSQVGIKLLTIYEDEWRDKKQIVESMILHRLNKSVNISARKLSVVKLKQKNAKDFFENNHLEGYAPSFVTFGLCDLGGKIFAALSLRKPFHKKKYENTFEVARSCCLLGYSVRGWLGKLTKYAKTYSLSLGAKKLMTYVDFRVGNGSAYELAGWTKIDDKSASLRFWWTDFRYRFNRFKFRANKKENLSQDQVAEKFGMIKIYGCSNSKFEILL
jgi:hypothetical protein